MAQFVSWIRVLDSNTWLTSLRRSYRGLMSISELVGRLGSGLVTSCPAMIVILRKYTAISALIPPWIRDSLNEMTLLVTNKENARVTARHFYRMELHSRCVFMLTRPYSDTPCVPFILHVCKLLVASMYFYCL